MSTWLKRILIALLLIFWFLLLMTPTVAVVLARSGQIQIGEPDGPHTRLFLLQEANNEGLGLERAQRVRSPEGVPDTVTCLRTTVRYWMWTPGAEAEPVEYCQCIDTTTGATVPEISPSCLTP